VVLVATVIYFVLKSATPTKNSSNIQQTSQSTSAVTATPAKTSKCSLNGTLPDPECNPGTIDPNVTQENIKTTICVSGYTARVRPSVTYTNKLKVQGIKDYGYDDTKLADYEEDHIIPLEIGGNPSDPNNLFPEPIQQAKQKDQVENFLHAQVCSGKITLSEAQKEITTNWYEVYATISK